MSTDQRVVRTAAATTPTSWMPLDISQVLAGEDPVERPRYLVRTDGVPLFYAGRVNGLHSPTETFKSWIASLVSADALAAGDRVAYFDFESDAADIVGRLMALGAPNIAELFDYYRPDESIGEDAALDLTGPGYGAVVFDGVTEALSLLGLKSTADVDVAAFHRRLPRPFADAGACVILTDHVTKAGGTDQRFATGSQHKLSGITGAAYGLTMVRPFGRGMVGEAKLSLAKDRPGYVRGQTHGTRVVARVTLDATTDPLSLLLHAPGHEAGVPELSRSVENILRVLRDEDHAMTPSEIGDAIVAGPWPQGYRRETIQRGLRELADKGLADSAAGRWWRTGS